MPLVNMKDMLQHAYHHNYAVGAFDLVNLDFLEGIMMAAEKARAPVILSLAESHYEFFDFDLVMPAVEAAAKRAKVPVAIHFDHGATLESAIKAVNLGCNGVMVDASHLAFPENVEVTQKVVSMAHGCGIPVEGELGYVPGVEGEDAQRHPGEVAYTTLAEAKAYVERTGVDFLAVSIGTVHGRMKGKPKLDYQRLKQINESLKIPLVIHGGTGLSDDQFRRLINNGISKINYFTALSDAAARQVKHNASAQAEGYTGLQRNVKQAIAEEVERCMRLWGSAGRAAEVLERCQPWQEVAHVIVYNAIGADDAQVKNVMSEGHKVLSGIPGVREVFTGEAVEQDDRYQYTWLVRFCHQNVIESYRHHPDHVTFADRYFRPIASDRISIDYQASAS